MSNQNQNQKEDIMSTGNKIDEQELKIQTIKQSLLNTAFKQYSDLIIFLRGLPFNQNLPGFHQAYINFDTGLLWIREMISSGHLVLPQTTDKAEEEKEDEKKD